MADSPDIAPGRRRLIVGCVLLLLSVLPWAIALFTPLLGLSSIRLASVVAALLVGGEIIGAIAVAVLGRETYVLIIGRLRRSKNESRQGSNPSSNGTHEKESLNE